MEEEGFDNSVASSESGESEKTLTQSEVNKIVAREKSRAAQAARREAEEQYSREIDTIRSGQEQRNSNVSKDVDADALYQQLTERFNQDMQKRQMESTMSQAADNYYSKIDSGKRDYEDFDDVTKEFDPTAFPQLVYLVSGMDNAADIIYDISKNPLKLASLDRLAEKSPKHAHSELLKLSRSISENKKAREEEDSNQVSDPLDRMQPSRVSGSNGKKMGINALRDQDWLRG